MAVRDARDVLSALQGDGWVRPFLRTHGRMLLLAVALSVAACVFASALMFTSGYMISLAATVPFTVLALHLPSILVRIFGIGKPVLQYFERLASHDWVLRMTSSLRRRLYEAVERGGADTSAGRALGLFADDLENMQNLCLRTLFPMVVIAAVYVLVVVAFGALSPAMGLLMFAVVGLAAFAMPFWSLAANAARVQRRQQVISDAYDSLAEDVFGVVDWGLSGRREEFLARLDGPYEAAFAEARARFSSERRCSVARQALYCVAVVGVFAWASYAFFGEAGAQADGFLATAAAQGVAGVAMHDSVPYAANWIAAFVLCMFPLLDVFSPATDAVAGVAEHAKALRELNALDARGGEGERDCAARGVHLARCRLPRNAIELEDVGFSHGASAAMLEGVDASIAKGSLVAVVGRSGAGKTTLLDLLSGRLAATSGEVRVDGKVGYIEQFPYVFRKSLRENLLLAKPDATDAEISAALRKVGLGDLLSRLPRGLDEFMAEGGATLSGGERHRLALARILLFDCDVVLLDEPYRGLDAGTREEVTETMREALSGKTVVMVTHDAPPPSADAVWTVADGGVQVSKFGVASGETCV